MQSNSPNVLEVTPRKSGPGVRVALYLRQSDKEQRLSIGQQRQECRTYAQSRGWEVSGEYIDDGKSGSKGIEQRQQWHKLLADAQRKDREFDAILCWDTSRFGRMDSVASSVYTDKLRKSGVWLETARGERIDWRVSIDRVMYAIQAEQNNKYSLDLSANVIRGRRAVFELGFWATPVKYGYDRQYVDNGKVMHTCPRNEVFSKPRNWRLVPVVNAEEAKVIKWVFEQWRTRDTSFMRTIHELYAKSIPSPSGKPSWTLAQVKGLLTERAYAGDNNIGDGGRTQEVHNRIGTRVKENAITAIIDRPTFNMVQRKVKAREGAEWRPKTASGPLSGVLKCGKCGHTLARRTCDGGTKYVCESATKRPHLGCSQWRVDEAELLPIVCKELVEAVDFEILQRLAAKPEKRDAGELEQLKKDEQRMRQQVERAAKNLALVDPENFTTVQEALSQMRREHERLANALKLTESNATPDQRAEWVKWWKGMKGQLIKVAEARPVTLDVHRLGSIMQTVSKANPVAADEFNFDCTGRGVTYHAPAIYASVDVLRDLLHRLNVEVHLHWERYGTTGKRWKLTTGVLRAMFNPNGEASEKTIVSPAIPAATAAQGEAAAKEAHPHASGSSIHP